MATVDRAALIASSIAGYACGPSTSGSIELPASSGRSETRLTRRASGTKWVPGSLAAICDSRRWRTMRERMRIARRCTRFTPSTA